MAAATKTPAGKLAPQPQQIAPRDQDELAAEVRAAYAAGAPLQPIGGGTSLDFGLPLRDASAQLLTTGLNRVIDYPARDMTVTVEAGLTMQQLATLLATERQRLPIDAPQADRATIGGMIATNFSGPRRYGQGTLRDYVIGIHAVDGRGEAFKGGGRVVKNVAGYDFCKLLTGSLGTLGIITQVTLKLKPIAEQLLLMACVAPNTAAAEKILTALSASETTPVAIELLAGPAWNANAALATLDRTSADRVYIVVALEGTSAEVEWMSRQLTAELRSAGVAALLTIGNSTDFWRDLVEFPAAGESPLTLKASVAPSGTTAIVDAARAIDPDCSIQAHAGNGVVLIRCATFPAQGLSRAIVGGLQPIAAKHGGHLCVMSNPSGTEMTHKAAWGGTAAPYVLMSEIKRRFDPRDILNRGRFVYV